MHLGRNVLIIARKVRRDCTPKICHGNSSVHEICKAKSLNADNNLRPKKVKVFLTRHSVWEIAFSGREVAQSAVAYIGEKKNHQRQAPKLVRFAAKTSRDAILRAEIEDTTGDLP